MKPTYALVAYYEYFCSNKHVITSYNWLTWLPLFFRLTLAEYHEQEEIFKLRLGHLKKVSIMGKCFSRDVISTLYRIQKWFGHLDKYNHSFVCCRNSALLFLLSYLVVFLFLNQCKPLSESMFYPSDLSVENMSIHRATHMIVLKAEMKYTELICLRLMVGLLC